MRKAWKYIAFALVLLLVFVPAGCAKKSEAVKVGLMVNHGAEGATAKKVRALLGDAVGEAA